MDPKSGATTVLDGHMGKPELTKTDEFEEKLQTALELHISALRRILLHCFALHCTALLSRFYDFDLISMNFIELHCIALHFQNTPSLKRARSIASATHLHLIALHWILLHCIAIQFQNLTL